MKTPAAPPDPSFCRTTVPRRGSLAGIGFLLPPVSTLRRQVAFHWNVDFSVASPCIHDFHAKKIRSHISRFEIRAWRRMSTFPTQVSDLTLCNAFYLRP